MNPSVFISHAGADAEAAGRVADVLRAEQIAVRHDRSELGLGDSFLSFMENALSTSDYCLLLWSRNAAATPWVTLEWESALWRSVHERRAFLMAARLENTPLPSLLSTRLRVDLFPDLRSGLLRLAGTWRADRAVERETARPTASSAQATGPLAEEPGVAKGTEIYVTSELFGVAVPWLVDLEAPSAVLLHQVIERFALPRQIDHQGLLGMRLAYRLMFRDGVLKLDGRLREEGIGPGSTVWLAVTMTPFSASAPIAGQLSPVTFRHAGAGTTADTVPLAAAQRAAWTVVRTALKRAGLGP